MQQRKLGRWIGIAGGLFTVGYLAFWGIVIHGRWATIQEMELNDVGDFLGGAFAPLAFLWLVLGFLQQGIELRQNSAALRLQAKELHTAAAHAGDMVTVARADLEANTRAIDAQTREMERQRAEAAEAVKPRIFFIPQGGSFGTSNQWRFAIANGGRECSEVSMRFSETTSLQVEPPEIPHLPKGSHPNLRFHLTPPKNMQTMLTVDYVDYNNVPGSADFLVRIDGHGMSIQAKRNQHPTV